MNGGNGVRMYPGGLYHFCINEVQVGFSHLITYKSYIK